MKRIALLVVALLLPLASGAAAFYGFSGAAIRFGSAAAVEVPDVVGQVSSAAADTVLEGVGLDLGAVTAQCSSAVVGHVTTQNPPAGASVALGTLVLVTTSSGTPCKGYPPLWIYLEQSK